MQDSQTQFSAEEPFFENPGSLPQEEKVVVPAVPFFRRRKTIIFIILVATVLLMCVLYVVNLIVERNRKLGEAPEVTITAPTTDTDNQYLRDVQALRAELKAADPSQVELQPPSLDFYIRLDQPER